MVVATAELTLVIFGAHSLKDKRRVVRSLKDRLRDRFEVAVAEVDEQDVHQRAVLGVAAVGNDGRHLRSVIDKVVEFCRRNGEAELADQRVDIYHPDFD